MATHNPDLTHQQGGPEGLADETSEADFAGYLGPPDPQSMLSPEPTTLATIPEPEVQPAPRRRIQILMGLLVVTVWFAGWVTLGNQVAARRMKKAEPVKEVVAERPTPVAAPVEAGAE